MKNTVLNIGATKVGAVICNASTPIRDTDKTADKMTVAIRNLFFMVWIIMSKKRVCIINSLPSMICV